MPVYGWLVARVQPRDAAARHLWIHGGGVRRHRPGVSQPTRTTWSPARVFYVGISVMNLLLVSVFWSFMLEIVQQRADQAAVRLHRRGRHHRRAGGPVADRPLVNAASAIPACCSSAPACSSSPSFCSALLLAQMAPHARPGCGQRCRRRSVARDRGARWQSVCRLSCCASQSPYLLGIALFVVGISAINTFLYFEQLRLVKDMFEEPEQRTQMFAQHRCHRAGADRHLAAVPHRLLAHELGVTALLVIVP